MKRIAVVTGTRAEYGVLQTVLQAIRRRRSLELQVIVTGMHLLREFGNTVREIERDGWPIIARVPMQRGDDQPLDQAQGLSRGVAGIAEALEAAKSDVVLVLGDRIEALAGALAGATSGRAVAHIHGGDVAPGDLDDSIRHAITKIAHIHFAATRAAGRRIVRLGEAAERVHTVGGPGLDRLRELIETEDRVDKTDTALVVVHACGRRAAEEQRIMARVLAAVAEAGLPRLIAWPNTDRGHRGVLAAISQHLKRSNGSARAVRSLPRDAYLRQLLGAAVLVGNSSSGIIEAPLAGTPSVNIGDRQAGREVGGRSVLSCGEGRQEIAATIRRALRLRPRRGGRNVYGDGRAGERIAEILSGLRIDRSLLRKRITY